jgi:hypothetical protein
MSHLSTHQKTTGQEKSFRSAILTGRRKLTTVNKPKISSCPHNPTTGIIGTTIFIATKFPSPHSKFRKSLISQMLWEF